MIAKFNVTPPQSSTAVELHPVSITISAELNYPAQLTAVFVDDWDNVGTESTTSRLQLNAYIDYTEAERGTTNHIFRGKIWSITREIIGGVPSLVVVAFDRLQEYNTALAVYNDGSTYHRIWSQYTTSQALSRVQLYKLPYYEGGYREQWAPKYDSEAWLSTTAVEALGINFTTNGYTITNGDTEIKAQTAAGNPGNLGFPPQGLLLINNAATPSVVAYNGYTYKASDDRWYFNNCDWVEDSGAGSAGLLGSTAANHVSGATVHLMIPKRIHFSTRILIEGKEAAAYEAIEDKHYTPNVEHGTFIFTQSPLSLQLNAAAYDSMWGSYAVYDEEAEEAGANLITLRSIITDTAGVARSEYGAGVAPSFTGPFANIIITRVVVDKPTYLMQFYRGLLSDLGLLRGVNYDALGFFYNSVANAVNFNFIAQATTADRVYTGVTRRMVDIDMADVRAAVGASFQQGEATNLIDTARMYHTVGQATDGGVHGSGSTPGIYYKVANQWWESVSLQPFSYSAVQATPSYATGGSSSEVLNLLTDGKSDTGVALMWDTAAHCEANDSFYAWFPGTDDHTPGTYYIKKVRVVLELIGQSQDTSSGFSATVKYYDDLTPDTTNPYTTAPTSANGSKYLDARLTKTFKTGTYNFDEVVFEADDLYVQGNGIAIEVDKCMQSTTSGELPAGYYGYMVKEIRVEGLDTHFTSVKLASTYSSSDSNTITAAASFAKLVDSSVGDYPIQLIELGPATLEVAKNFCWLQLLQLLAQAQAKEFDIAGEGIALAGVPILLETLQMQDGATPSIGVVDSYTYTVAGGERNLNVRIIDYNTPLFGAAV